MHKEYLNFLIHCDIMMETIVMKEPVAANTSHCNEYGIYPGVFYRLAFYFLLP